MSIKMFISDVHKREECMSEATQDLRKLGIKCRPKKIKVQTNKSAHKVFKVALGQLPMSTVTLVSGQQIVVPRLVHELCSFILTKVETEGIFRKEGSKSRQHEIKRLLDAGKSLGLEHHVIDVAVVLKLFLRELTEPLIPYGYHELFLRCVLLEKNKLKAVLLSCLLLPVEHLNTLSYLMQFFAQIAEYADYNKMNPYNLAVVIGPSVFPVEEKLSPNPQLRMAKTSELFQLLIENAHSVGVIPEDIIERVGHSKANVSDELKKKKRRSGSLTRMFNGLKKIVGGKFAEDNSTIVTPDLLITPINSMKKKRALTNGISNKKKKDVINKLPENSLLNTPFTPCRTPVSMDLSGPQEVPEIVTKEKEKKSQWFSRSKSTKNLKEEIPNKKTSKITLERRWSGITQAANLRKAKKRNSCAASLPPSKQTSNKNEISSEPDYIRVSKIEYEAIKNRVSAMERRISLEIENVQSQIVHNENENNVNVEVDIKNVQTVYEQTLVQTEQLSPTTDHLAKRLSRELKIRRSADQKIIRSPSARKIGSMRRKSRELEQSKLTRHRSWHVAPRDIPRVSLKRGKPNTASSGLTLNKNDNLQTERKNSTNIKRSHSSSCDTKLAVSCNLSGSSTDAWVSAENFFATLKSCNNSVNSCNDVDSVNGRASLAKLRSQNAGMVLAKAKLFDKLRDSDSSSNSSNSYNSYKSSIPRAKISYNTNRIGSNNRHLENTRMSYRVRALKHEDRKLTRKNMSPRRRNKELLLQKHKMHLAKQYLDDSVDKNSDKENLPENFILCDKSPIVPLKDCNRNVENHKSLTPNCKTTPHIKKSLGAKSPKRLCRTPGVERNTPLRVLKTPTYSNKY